MRLLVLTNLYPPQNLGGFGLCIQRLTQGLARRGYQPIVLTSDQPYLGEAGQDRSVLRLLELLGSYDGGLSRLSDTAEEERIRRSNGHILAKVVAWQRPQACLVGNLDLLGPDLLQHLLELGIPSIQHVGFMGAPMPLAEYPTHRHYGMAFASGEVRRLLVSQGFPVTTQPIVHPPLAADTLPAPATNRQGGGALQIGYSGLLMQSKGVHVLLEACARLRQWGTPFRLQLAGKAFSTDYAQALQAYVVTNNLDPCVHWHGFLEEHQLNSFYQQLDVLVFPSLHPESFGMVVAEAMACGVVPISSGVGGAFEVVTHGLDGLLSPAGDSTALAEALRWCQMHRVRVKSMAQRARQSATLRFTPARSASLLDQAFRQLHTDLTRTQF